MKTYVITGATGGIGYALIEYLLARGDAVIALLRPGSTRAGSLPVSPRLTVREVSVEDYEGYAPDERADAFFHLAWVKTVGAGRDDADIQEKNISHTLSAVRLAARYGCTVFVGAGSQAEYGRQTAPLRPDTPVCPESGYGVAKYAAGKLSYLLSSSLGIRHVWARILSVYGERDLSTTLIRYLMDTLMRGERPSLTPCEQIWDYLYVTDAARALAAMADDAPDGAVYPLGSGEARPLREYVTTLRDIVAPTVPLGFGERPYYPHQPMFLSADLTALTHDTGFVPEVPFAEGIRRIKEALYAGK